MKGRKIEAILWKQLKDTFKNKAVLIQFVMFPAMAIILEKATDIEGLGENYFVMLFATMYIGMAPLTAMASIMAEEKEKNTLRMLIMSNVKAQEYFLGVGSYIMLMCALGALVFGLTAGFSGLLLLKFVFVMLLGVIISTGLGATVGVVCKNQITATSMYVPLMMIFSFLPMLAMFNKNIAFVSKFTYSQQIKYLLNDIGTTAVQLETVLVLAINFMIILILFVMAYRRNRFA